MRPVLRIIFNNLTMNNTMYDFIKRQAIRESFGVSVGRDLDLLMAYRVGNIFNVHLRLL